jgi:hypothetical protein
MTTENTETRLATTQEPSVATMLQGALANIQSGAITPEHVEVLGKMMDLYERNEKRQAERDFAVALAALQGETIRVNATKKVDEKPDGSFRYNFAPYEEIMAKVQPMLTAHGFSVTFDTEISSDNTRLTSICTLTHKTGHSRINKFAVRFGKPPGSSDAQGDMSTKSYAKRGALCDALNISIDHDKDGREDVRIEGGPITQEQADELRDLVDESGADKQKFLEYAQAETFEEIASAKLPVLHKRLLAKMKAAGK